LNDAPGGRHVGSIDRIADETGGGEGQIIGDRPPLCRKSRRLLVALGDGRLIEGLPVRVENCALEHAPIRRYLCARRRGNERERN
jgi:hypothetical protein